MPFVVGSDLYFNSPSENFTVLVCYTNVCEYPSEIPMAIIALKSVTFFYQRTPLHVAASKGRDYTVECLVQKGADMNIKDKTGVC